MAQSETVPTPQEIRQARINAGLSLEGMAEQIGVYYKTLGAWENGTREISAKKLGALVGWMRARGWVSPGIAYPDPTVSASRVAEGDLIDPRGANATQVLAALHGRISEILLLQRHADNRLAAIQRAIERFGVKLPEDTEAEANRRTGTG